ncbi:MAG: hypothetical protein QXX17_06280 [Conexivisphaerales archaeon]
MNQTFEASALVIFSVLRHGLDEPVADASLHRHLSGHVDELRRYILVEDPLDYRESALDPLAQRENAPRSDHEDRE